MKTKKSLGQHFLNSAKIISDIVLSAKVKKDDLVLEIGPGEGVMTSALLKTGATTVVVEKDDRLIPFLNDKFSKEVSSKQLEILHGDILDQTILKEFFKKNKQYKLVANIPYYITGQIIRLFLETEKQPELITLLIQKEVAERIITKNKKENLLSLSVKFYGTPKIVRMVGRGAFRPQPNVDSAVLLIENLSKKRSLEISSELFFKLIHVGFAHKRKQLLPNLSDLYKKEDLISAFEKCEINLKSRAEDLSLETWVKLCKTIC